MGGWSGSWVVGRLNKVDKDELSPFEVEFELVLSLKSDVVICTRLAKQAEIPCCI